MNRWKIEKGSKNDGVTRRQVDPFTGTILSHPREITSISRESGCHVMQGVSRGFSLDSLSDRYLSAKRTTNVRTTFRTPCRRHPPWLNEACFSRLSAWNLITSWGGTFFGSIEVEMVSKKRRSSFIMLRRRSTKRDSPSLSSLVTAYNSFILFLFIFERWKQTRCIISVRLISLFFSISTK